MGSAQASPARTVGRPVSNDAEASEREGLRQIEQHKGPVMWRDHFFLKTTAALRQFWDAAIEGLKTCVESMDTQQGHEEWTKLRRSGLKAIRIRSGTTEAD